MNTCGTCKHFGPLAQSLDAWDVDGNELPNTRLHKCNLLAHLNHHGKITGVIAGVVDGSGYFAALCVSEEFGCNQWAAPEVKP